MNEDDSEVLKAGAEAVVRPFADLIEKLFGGAIEQIGGAWEDTIPLSVTYITGYHLTLSIFFASRIRF
jgi:hypothetical protein